MSRFRLRYLLQEFDLVAPELVIGRAPECGLTIDDPLISRQHARVTVQDGVARVEDMGSRNGVRLNGRLVKEPLALTDGDRIRVGTQELVFTVGRAGSLPRSTGYLKVCSACGTPYSDGSASCPQCNAPALQDEDTLTGNHAVPKQTWAFQVLGEVIERSLSTGRNTEAERLMRRVVREVDERVKSGEILSADNLNNVARFAIRLAKVVGSPTWLSWAFELYRRHGELPTLPVRKELSRFDFANPEEPELTQLWRGFARFARSLPPSDAQSATVSLGPAAKE